DIIVTEDSGLHLLWYCDKIYIKPMPKYLLSYPFWQDCLRNLHQALGTMQTHRKPCASAPGFVRSYVFPIRHESDFRIATNKDSGLLPTSMTWCQWSKFREQIMRINDDDDDDDVSGRYQYGEIRLSRLNLYCKVLLRKLHYHRTHGQYGDYFANLYPSLLFMFALLSIILASMQLSATVKVEEEGAWDQLLAIYRIFGIVMVAISLLLSVGMSLLLVVKVVKEWVFALKMRSRLGSSEKKRQNHGTLEV
ncbi:hypothetical protein P171DRAFT_355891, partial [Karstenula rhodostoma CBS 690.94]